MIYFVESLLQKCTVCVSMVYNTRNYMYIEVLE